jgi:hypothetical protein
MFIVVWRKFGYRIVSSDESMNIMSSMNIFRRHASFTYEGLCGSVRSKELLRR